MKIVVSSPFRAGSTWLVGLLCRTFNFNRVDYGSISPPSVANAQNDTVIRTNAVIGSSMLGTAVGIRLTRGIHDAISAKLMYGVLNYLKGGVSLSSDFQAFLDEVKTYPAESRTAKNIVELAVDKHMGVVGQFTRENLSHILSPSSGLTLVTYEQLCGDAIGWLKAFAQTHSLDCAVPPHQAVSQLTPATLADLPIANWTAANISPAAFRKMTNRIETIRTQLTS